MMALIRNGRSFVASMGLLTLVACGGGGGSAPDGVGPDGEETKKSAVALVSSLLNTSPTTLTFENAFKSVSLSYTSVRCPGAGNTFIVVDNLDGIPNIPENNSGVPDSVTLNNLECVLSDTLDSRSALKSKLSGKTTTTLTELKDYIGNDPKNYSYKMESTSNQTETFFKFVTAKPSEASFTGSHQTSFTSTTSVSRKTTVDEEDIEESEDAEISVATVSTVGQLNGNSIAANARIDSNCVRASDRLAKCDKYNVSWTGNYAWIGDNNAKDNAFVTTSTTTISSTVTKLLTLNSNSIPIAGELTIVFGGEKITALFSQDGNVPKVIITSNGKAGAAITFSELESAAKKFRY
jgi:hypothetical protein